jgi:formate--tetrahydrofolate ligase
MAILCLARDLKELKHRLGQIVAGVARDGSPITARDLQADGAMAALLRDAIRPNLVQTIEGGPALVHGGPFANIAHGCSTIIATECGLGLADYLVTEAGFASELGAEKFLNIVCPSLGRGPDAIVLVATVRAVQHHGGSEDAQGIEKGLGNVLRHAAHLSHYGPPVIVSINRFRDDTDDEIELLMTLLKEHGIRSVVADPAGRGGPGCTDVAEAVVEATQQPSPFQPLYSNSDSAEAKLNAIATKAYGAEGIDLSEEAKKKLDWAAKHGLDKVPVCVAKTQYSLSADPTKINAPTGFRIPIREFKVSAGAGFLVAIAGEMMLMPGLGKEPSAHRIDVDDSGRINGLF